MAPAPPYIKGTTVRCFLCARLPLFRSLSLSLASARVSSLRASRLSRPFYSLRGRTSLLSSRPLASRLSSLASSFLAPLLCPPLAPRRISPRLVPRPLLSRLVSRPDPLFSGVAASRASALPPLLTTSSLTRPSLLVDAACQQQLHLLLSTCRLCLCPPLHDRRSCFCAWSRADCCCCCFPPFLLLLVAPSPLPDAHRLLFLVRTSHAFSCCLLSSATTCGGHLKLCVVLADHLLPASRPERRVRLPARQ